jgi:hypothetical protein
MDMWWFSELWSACLTQYQRGWIEAIGWWNQWAGLPTMTEETPNNPFSSVFMPGVFTPAWPAALAMPGIPRVEAQIEPLNIEGATKAARLSMRIFMPWGEPFWVEALIGRQEGSTDLLLGGDVKK